MYDVNVRYVTEGRRREGDQLGFGVLIDYEEFQQQTVCQLSCPPPSIYGTQPIQSLLLPFTFPTKGLAGPVNLFRTTNEPRTHSQDISKLRILFTCLTANEVEPTTLLSV